MYNNQLYNKDQSSAVRQILGRESLRVPYEERGAAAGICGARGILQTESGRVVDPSQSAPNMPAPAEQDVQPVGVTQSIGSGTE